MTVYVTRHAQPLPAREYDGDRERDRPLSELGRRQARRLGERLAAEGFAGTVYASPFQRCLETADLACRAAELTFRPEPAIAEVAGDWIDAFRGLGSEEIREAYACCEERTDALAPEWWPEAAEDSDDVEGRVAAFLDRELSGVDGDVLLVGHGATTGAAVIVLCREHVDSALTGSAGYALHYNAALTAVDVDGEPTLLFGNDTDHLEPGQVTSNATRVG